MQLVLLTLAISLCITGCIASGNSNFAKHSSTEKHAVVYQYCITDSLVRRFHIEQFLDSGSFRIRVSDTLMRFTTYNFIEELLAMRYRTERIDDPKEVARKHREEAGRNPQWEREYHRKVIPELAQIGSTPEAPLHLYFSEVHSDVIPGYEMFVAEIHPSYGPAMEADLNSRGIATRTWLHYLFIMRGDSIERVFSGIMTQ